MRKKLIVLSIIFITCLLISCEEAFNPQGEFDDQYVLNCVLKIDTTFQMATISRSYKASLGYTTTGNIDDASIQGAKITLTCSNLLGTEVYHFRDTIIQNSTDTQYKTPIHFYYLKNFNPSITAVEINPGVFQIYGYGLKIEAVLANGKKLTSLAYTTGIDSYKISAYKQRNPVKLGTDNLSYEIYSNSQPELLIEYSKYENDNWADYEKIVPKYYAIHGSTEIPIYPTIEMYEPYVKYDTLIIRKTLQNISAGDPNKQNYIIKNIVFMLNVLDYNLTTYISSQQTFSTDYSYRGTPPEYKSVTGGLGIFGAMYTIKMNLQLPHMIRSLGYRTN